MSRFNLAGLLASAAFAFVLSACGGGGGGSPDAPQVATKPVSASTCYVANPDATKPCVLDADAIKRSVLYAGDQTALKNNFAMMEKGGTYGICAIGGSITAGEVAPWYDIDKTYMGRLLFWFEQTFPNSKFELHNAAISGTESSFGADRVGAFLNAYHCTIMIVEFAVNDNGNAKANPGWVEVEYGRMLTNIVNAGTIPVALETMLPSCASAQEQHYEVYSAKHLPLMVSESNAICNSGLTESDWNADGTHPNAYGHLLLATLLTKNFEGMMR